MAGGRVDLRSDTVTLPSTAMRAAMARARLGDDGYGEDPETNELQELCADLFGHEAALFTPSGTMSNQLALRVLTRPGDELLVDADAHLATYEGAPTADLAGLSLHAVSTGDGVLTPSDLDAAVDARARDPRYSAPALVGLENTINYRAGRVVPVERLRQVSDHARALGMHVHLDGARIFNAIVASGAGPRAFGACATTVAVCFAKGLGAPFGSCLVGPRDVIVEAEYYRKSYGGALHQSGVLAAAALHGIRHHVDRLAEDHRRARHLAMRLSDAAGVREVWPVDSNIVIVETMADGPSAERVVAALAEHGVLALAISRRRVRFVTHLDVDDADVAVAADAMERVMADLAASHRGTVAARHASSARPASSSDAPSRTLTTGRRVPIRHETAL